MRLESYARTTTKDSECPGICTCVESRRLPAEGFKQRSDVRKSFVVVVWKEARAQRDPRWWWEKLILML